MDSPLPGHARLGRWTALRNDLAVAIALMLLVSSCTFSESEEGEAQGDTRFDIAIGVEPDTLDPAGTTTTTIANILDYSVETLVRIDKQGKIHPHLAESWETSSDGRALTLHLRRGVKFHDGTPFNAEAVKFTLERLLDPDVTVPIRAPYSAIEQVEAVDGATVRLGLKHPSPALISALSWTTAAILSPASVERSGNSYKRVVHPVGTGPYVFASYQRGDRVTVKRFSEYWGEKPYYETVVFRIIPEAASRESLLRAGQADLIVLPPISDLKALQDDPKTDVLLAPSDRSIFIAINTLKIKDPRVRQALNYAVDKEALIRNLLFDAGEPLDAPMSATLAGYCRTGSYSFDPQKARALLVEAGADRLRVLLGTPTGRYLQDKEVIDAVAGYLRDVGIAVQVESTDWASYVAAITAPPSQQKFDMHLLGWAPSFLDASMQMDQFRQSQHPPAGLATSFYKNERVNELLSQADQEVDTARREQLYCDAAKIIWDEAPWIFLWSQKFPIAYSNAVTNISFLPNEKFDAIYARPA